MPIAIIGTGRSGTSMIARMLNLCGVYLGEAPDLTNKGAPNPKGFWENVQFFNFNQRLLAALGASYETPARFEPGWEYDSKLDGFYEEACALIENCFAGPARAQGATDWGWKQPGATSTLAFWRRVVPNLTLVLCLRNPLDYAASVDNFAYIAQSHALTLWQYYNLDMLNSTRVEDRTITFYEDYFPDYRRGLEPAAAAPRFGVPCAGQRSGSGDRRVP